MWNGRARAVLWRRRIRRVVGHVGWRVKRVDSGHSRPNALRYLTLGTLRDGVLRQFTRKDLTDSMISREEMVKFLEYAANSVSFVRKGRRIK